MSTDHGDVARCRPDLSAAELTSHDPDLAAFELLGQAGALIRESLEGPEPEPLTEHLRGVAHERWHATAVAWLERYEGWLDA